MFFAPFARGFPQHGFIPHLLNIRFCLLIFYFQKLIAFCLYLCKNIQHCILVLSKPIFCEYFRVFVFIFFYKFSSTQLGLIFLSGTTDVHLFWCFSLLSQAPSKAWRFLVVLPDVRISRLPWSSAWARMCQQGAFSTPHWVLQGLQWLMVGSPR